MLISALPDPSVSSALASVQSLGASLPATFPKELRSRHCPQSVIDDIIVTKYSSEILTSSLPSKHTFKETELSLPLTRFVLA